jgi:predicted Zn-dependent protease
MKTKIVVLTLCVAFVLGAVLSANAQLKANSPEDRAFSAIEAEKNQGAKLQLLIDFDKNFPNSEVQATIYSMMMDIYKERNDTAKVDEVGEKAIKADPSNIDALMILARNYAMGKTNVDRAVQYAQRAVDSVAKKRGTPAPPNYTDAQWKQYLDSMDQSAKGLLVYAKSVKP